MANDKTDNNDTLILGVLALAVGVAAGVIGFGGNASAGRPSDRIREAINMAEPAEITQRASESSGGGSLDRIEDFNAMQHGNLPGVPRTINANLGSGELGTGGAVSPDANLPRNLTPYEGELLDTDPSQAARSLSPVGGSGLRGD